MFKNLLWLLLVLAPVAAFSQNVNFTGKVTDPDNTPLESATIYLTRVKDSTVLEYTISDSEGKWELRTRATQDSTDLKVSFMGFTDFKERLKTITADRDFGTIKMSDLHTELNEVIVEGEVPPIRIKKDTLEFNASSFKVRPDANVETLLKQLPGVQIDSEGKITVNGKEVNQILVNGKPFFDSNGQVALKNLPAEIIDKVQVSDTKTKKEELTGEAASGDNASINLTIQEDKNKGLFGKINGGYGTDNRYEGSFLINYFKNKRKLSVLASSNNINSVGFSMNDIFGSMGGGRVMGLDFGMNNSMSYNGTQFVSNGNGITRSSMAGLNYSDEPVKDFDTTVSYFYTTADTENDNRTNRTTFLTTNDTEETNTDERSIISESASHSESSRFTHNINTQIRAKIDSTATFNFDPKFTRTNASSSSVSSQTTRNQDNEMLNESDGSSYSDSNTTALSGSLVFNKQLKKKKRYLNANFRGNMNNRDDEQYTLSNNTFYNEDADGDGLPDITTDNRNQLQRVKNEENSYTVEIEYNEPITDSISLATSVEYKYNKSINDNEGYSFNEATGEFTDENELITNYLSSGSDVIEPKIQLRMNKGKFYYSLSGGTEITTLDAYGTYFSENYSIRRNYLLPDVNAFIRLRQSKTKSISLYYSYDATLPSARQLLPIEDLSNPLSTETGNPNLSPSRRHSASLSIRDYDYMSRAGYSIYIRGNYSEANIVSNTLIDESAKRTTTYTNLDGNYGLSIRADWDKSVKREANTFRFGGAINTSLNHSRGYNNGNLYEADSYRIGPEVQFSYEYGELLIINTRYNFNYNESHYTNYSINNTSYATHNVTVGTTSYWPKHVVFGNDFRFNYNTRLGEGFKAGAYLWNMSLGYNFFNDKLLFKATAYDLLKQNVGTSRYVNDTSITDQQNTVLQQYFMFSLTYTLSKFGGNAQGMGLRHRRF